MHCVFYAIKDHLSYLGIEALHDDWLIYEGARTIADNRQDTSICIVPYIAAAIAQRHNLEFWLKLIEPFNVKWHKDQATPNEKLLILPWLTHFEHSRKEGIYFPKFTMHAQFLLKKPEEEYVMKILLRRK